MVADAFTILSGYRAHVTHRHTDENSMLEAIMGADNLADTLQDDVLHFIVNHEQTQSQAPHLYNAVGNLPVDLYHFNSAEYAEFDDSDFALPSLTTALN